jgi:3-phytase
MVRNFFWVGLVSFVLAGCQSLLKASDQNIIQDNQRLSVVKLQPFSSNQNIAGKIARPIVHAEQQYWLLTSEQDGLLLTDSQGNTLSQYNGNFELMDWRADMQLGTQTVDLIATVDNETGRVLVLALDWRTKQLSQVAMIDQATAVETLCWNKMPQGHLSLFSVDNLGSVTQRIIVDADTHKINPVLVRQFTGVPEAKSCAVDDQTASLYIVEENIGVWRYSADPEAELQRELIAVSGDLGNLEGEVTSVEVLADGSLLIATPQQQGFWRIDPGNNNAATFYSLPQSSAIESVTALIFSEDHVSNLLLGLFDGNTGLYHQAKLNMALPQRNLVPTAFSQIFASAETAPVTVQGDAADDPAIWFNANSPEQSRILATNKKRGLMLHDLQGKLIQQLDVGRVNNVDLRHGFKLGEQTIDIAAASNRTNRSISLFAIAPDNGMLNWLVDIPTSLNDVYGLCMYQANDKYYVFINDTDGQFQQYLLHANNDKVDATLVREFNVASQPEGCVADDQLGQLYYGEEGRGIWQIAAEAEEVSAQLIAELGGNFVADVEGLALYHLEGARYLIASSQGNNSYAVFALDQDNRYLGSFQVAMNLQAGIDGSSETDGLDMLSVSVGPQFSEGLFVVQDGHNVMPSATQNFKLVSAAPIAELIRSWR